MIRRSCSFIYLALIVAQALLGVSCRSFTRSERYNETDTSTPSRLDGKPTITILAPVEHQVIQRSSKKRGTASVLGALAHCDGKRCVVEARWIVGGTAGRWRRIAVQRTDERFRAQIAGPAGGWHRLEFRVMSGTNTLAEAEIAHIGIGEVFVIAGQSNSANHGEEKQKTRSGLVAAKDGAHWRIAHDPQPGASGQGGSIVPPFGDIMAETFHVPIGFVSCGVGATSVREWLPQGETFPNPPTITSNVKRLPSGQWESRGDIYAAFIERLRSLGPKGFRAVLWHQGESDANQDDPTRTLPGSLYRLYMQKLVQASQRDIGWRAPWFVAQASYHVPGDEGSPDIRQAQASLWRNGIALEGPDSDALKGELRENGGKGVHFSGRGLREHATRWAEKVAPWLKQVE